VTHEEFITAAIAHDWPDHVIESFEYWTSRGSEITHVGPAVIALRTRGGAELRATRGHGFEDIARANRELPPVVDAGVSSWDLGGTP
jgi:hypothetical protein